MDKRIQNLTHITSLVTGDYVPVGLLSSDPARRAALFDIYKLYNDTWGVGGAGEVNIGQTVGDSSGIYHSKVGVNLLFKSLVPGYYLPITGGTGTLGFDINTSKVLVADTTLLSSNPNIKTTLSVNSGNPFGYFAIADSGTIDNNLMFIGYSANGQPVKIEFKGNNNITAALINRRELSGNWKLDNSDLITRALNPVFTTGTQNIGGNKTFNTDNVYFFDAPGVFNAATFIQDDGFKFYKYDNTLNLDAWNSILSGVWEAQTINISTNLNLQGVGVANINNLTTTGQNLWLRMISLSGDLQTTGRTLYNLHTGISGTPANLTSTGQTLWNRIVSLSGDLQSTGSNLINITTTISGNLNTTGATCYNLANTANTTANNNVTTSNLISGNLITTGITLLGAIQGLSGRLIVTGYNSYVWLTGASGVLNTKINDLSGYVNGTFETLADASASHFTINQDISDLQAGLLDNGNLITGVKNNLATTGTTLNNKINSLSGVTVTTTLGHTLNGNTTFAGDVVFYDSIFDINVLTKSPSVGINIYGTGENLVLNTWKSILSGNWTAQNLNITENLSFTGNPSPSNTNQNAISLYNKTLASKGILYLNGGKSEFSYPVGAAIWDKHVQLITTNSSTSQTSYGNSATNFGTLSHVADQYYGYLTNIVTASQPLPQNAFTNFGTPNLFIGNTSGKNGFFVTSKFAFVDNTGSYISGSNPSSGLRFFFGVTDQSIATILGANDSNSNRIGFSFIRGSGGSQDGRNDSDFKITTKNGETETLFNTNLDFNSGLYQGYIFCPPYPNTGSIYWQLNDINRGSFVSGLITGTLPSGNLAMRAGIGLTTLETGSSKNIRVQILYSEV